MKLDTEMSSREYAAIPFVKAAIDELTHAEQILFYGGFNDRDKAVKTGAVVAELREIFGVFE